MPNIPFGLQAYKRSNAFLPEVECLNLYIEKDQTGAVPGGFVRIQRPGLTAQVTLGGPIRGLFQQSGVLNGALIAVSADTLRNVTSGATIGTLTNDGARVEFAPTYIGLYVLSGGTISYTAGSTLVSIAAPDGRQFVSIDTINNYVVALCADGRFYWIEPGATTIDALNFATAESSPDGGVAVRRIVDEVWFFGASTVEPWQATGEADAPFQRASGRVYDRGCASRDTVQRFDNGILWEGDDGIIYRTSNVPQAISTNGVEERIAQASGPRSAFTFDTNGHKFYCLKIPGQGDFAYDAREGEWMQLASPNSTAFRPWVGFEHICGSSDDGTIWQMGDSTATDDGQPFRRAVSGIVPIGGKPQRNPGLSITLGMSADVDVRLRWRDADEQFPGYWEEFVLSAPADNLNMRRMGQIRSPWRVFELETTDPARISIMDATFGEAWD